MRGAAELFRSVFGSEPAGVWGAPGRINLIGEHTDYNLGLVLPFALANRAEVAMRPRGNGIVRIFSAQESTRMIEISNRDLAPGRPAGWAAYVASVPWVLRVGSGFDIAIDSSVPMGSGLSSSAALLCAIGLGIDELLELGLTRRELARRTWTAENEYVGAPTGGMDQIASLFCTEAHALLYDVRDDTMEQIAFDPHSADIEVLVVDTNVRHRHADGAYVERRHDCEQAAQLLGVASLREVSVLELESMLPHLEEQLAKRVKHVVSENQRVLETVAGLSRRNWVAVGALLTAGHISIRDDFEASSPEQDLAVDALADCGALGARMTGGGFGGAALSLMPAGSVERAHKEVVGAFERRGYATPHLFTVAPSAGAGRIA